MPPLPKLLSIISTASHQQLANHFYATVVRSKDLIPLYCDVVLWMLKRDLLIRLHLRIRIIATVELKTRVRKGWEEHVMRKRSRSRARSISIGRSRERGNDSPDRGRGRRGGVDEKTGPNLETVSESSPVEYSVSLSPKTARKQTRQRSPEKVKASHESDEEEADTREKAEELDDDNLWSSADEAKWDEYYKGGGNDHVASMISDPARATPLERQWLAGMSVGKEPHVARQFARCVRMRLAVTV